MAAGPGLRFGAGGPKAFVELAGRPLLEWSVDAAKAASSVDRIVVTVPAGARLMAKHEPAVTRVEGGASRSASVAEGLRHVESGIVLIHDAARPLAGAELFDAVYERLLADEDLAGVVAATPATDTIKEVGEDGEVVRTPPRARLWNVQTPQAFRTEALRDAFAGANLDTATDDAMLVEAAGGRVAVLEASPENIKVTHPSDLERAEMLLRVR